jgi:hypothetical protein
MARKMAQEALNLQGTDPNPRRIFFGCVLRASSLNECMPDACSAPRPGNGAVARPHRRRAAPSPAPLRASYDGSTPQCLCLLRMMALWAMRRRALMRMNPPESCWLNPPSRCMLERSWS